MSGSVIERFGHEYVGEGLDVRIQYDERPATWERADDLAGKRLDRRRRYAIIKDKVCESVRWVEACTGCAEGNGYGRPERGMGCEECGHRGRVRRSFWTPIDGSMPQ